MHRDKGKFLSIVNLYRGGNMDIRRINKALEIFKKRNRKLFANWGSTSFKIGHVHEPARLVTSCLSLI